MTVLATSQGAWLLWVVLPYLAIATFVVGNIWRYRTDQVHWTSRSSQLLESRWLRLGSPLFHFGLLAVIGGHVLGILVPQSWTEAVGISENTYHWIAAIPGTLAGTAMIAGLALLIIRRVRDARVSRVTTTMDVAVLVLLAFMTATGMWNTVWHSLIEGGYNYRDTVSPWFRGLFVADPQPSLMTGTAIPLSYQLHAIGGWLLILIWPFTRLVHAWSVPIAYLFRRPILYRSRAPRAARAGAGGLAEVGAPSLGAGEEAAGVR